MFVFLKEPIYMFSYELEMYSTDENTCD